MADIKNKDEAVMQNLEDAGLDSSMMKCFMTLRAEGNKMGQLRLLSKQRMFLLESMHENQKSIDCLDYLVYSMKKEGS